MAETPSGLAPFDPRAPLPRGLVVLEASAGTGKTHALTSLALRYVAEAAVPAAEICVASFTEAATAELRGRVRRRLVDALDHLRRRADGHGAPSPDPVVEMLAETDADELRSRVDRLERAVVEFDLATITTIHGLCGRLLAIAGLATDESGIVDGEQDVYEAVHDLYLARVARAEAGTGPDEDALDDLLGIDPERVAKVTLTKLSMPDAELLRPDVDADGSKVSASGLRHQRLVRCAADFVDDTVGEVRRRRRHQRRRTFDGIISDTRDHLFGPRGPDTIRAVRERFSVVLLDEFQDTDRVQWDIVQRAFVAPVAGTATPAVVLVGDPKQAIYRFRSAELTAYLSAVTSADHAATLASNWRSDPPLLDALAHLFDGFEFGDPAVAFQPVWAAHHTRGIQPGSPLQLRLVPQESGDLDVPRARAWIRADVLRVVHELLDGSTTVIVDRDDPGVVRPLRPGDIAVLTRTNSEAGLVAATLGRAGIAVATASSTSVMDSEAARQWELLLRALERPSDPGAARAAALGWFIGWAPADLDDLTEPVAADRMTELHDLLDEWAQLVARRGLPALLARARAAGLHTRLLGRVGGDRHATDVEHIAELLGARAGGRAVGAAALRSAFVGLQRGVEPEDLASDVFARRIDRDDDAVQVMTVHRAKGLEFPVVLCPFLWAAAGSQGARHAHDPDLDRRVLDTSWVAAINAAKVNERVRELARAEERGEARRLLYVALTRARHRCIVWWAPTTTGAQRGPLGELLAHATGQTVAPTNAAELEGLVARCDGTIEVAEVAPPRSSGTHRTSRRTAASNAAVDGTDLQVATAQRELDRAWRIWSFSALTAARSEGDVPAVSATDDGPLPPIGGIDEPTPVPMSPTGEPAPPVTEAPPDTPLADAPAGTAFGTLVHSVLEQCDFAHDQLLDHLVERCAQALAMRPVATTPSALAEGLCAMIHAPLGGPLGSFRLRDLPRADRLDELEFHLPLGRTSLQALGGVLLEHLDAADPFRGWAEALAGTVDAWSDRRSTDPDVEFLGRLTGSIDLVARSSAPGDTRPRYWVADYKTNRLGASDRYRPDALVGAMIDHDYPLQALLYQVALHRYLRWRLPSYDPDHDLLGSAYLFVRGMRPAAPADAGPGVVGADEVTGVRWWRPATAALDAVDRLLAGGGPR